MEYSPFSSPWKITVLQHATLGFTQNHFKSTKQLIFSLTRENNSTTQNNSYFLIFYSTANVICKNLTCVYLKCPFTLYLTLPHLFCLSLQQNNLMLALDNCNETKSMEARQLMKRSPPAV